MVDLDRADPDDADLDMADVGPDNLAALDRLFATERSTRHCWCMAFCRSGPAFAAGWYGGGNRRHFEAMAARGPMGVLAALNDEPVGWCACGPRARYRAAEQGRSRPLTLLPRGDDDRVWLVACIFVARDARGRVALPLIRAAVDLARRQGASAVEAWPVSSSTRRRPEWAHVGREAAFTRLGFTIVGRPTPDRAIMRLDLAG